MRRLCIDLSVAHDWHDIQSGEGIGVVLYYPQSSYKLAASLIPTAFIPNIHYCQIKFDSDPSIFYATSNPAEILRPFKKIWLFNYIVTDIAEPGGYLYVYILESPKDVVKLQSLNKFFWVYYHSIAVPAASSQPLYFENFAPIIDRVFLAATVNNVLNRIEVRSGNVVLLSFAGALQYNQNSITIGRVTDLNLVNTDPINPLDFSDIYLFMRGTV